MGTDVVQTAETRWCKTLALALSRSECGPGLGGVTTWRAAGQSNGELRRELRMVSL